MLFNIDAPLSEHLIERLTMTEGHKSYLISGSAFPGPPNIFYWTELATVVQRRRNRLVVELIRVRMDDWTLDFKNWRNSLAWTINVTLTALVYWALIVPIEWVNERWTTVANSVQ